MHVLMTGGTGRLAQHVLSRPRASHALWRILSRRQPSGPRDWAVGDLTTGEGLGAALEGIDAVLHLASNALRPADDVAAAGHLVGACQAAGVAHLVFLSIVGVDRIPYAYYQAKHAAEDIVLRGGVPSTILRATQFHSFVDWLLQRALRVPGLILVPAGFSVQSVAEEEVADCLLDILQAGPLGRAQDVVGPEILDASTAARTWRDARQLRRVVLPVPTPGAVARAFRTGANTAPEGERGRETWDAWLRRRYHSPPSGSRPEATPR